jgi:hypothetical protein
MASPSYVTACPPFSLTIFFPACTKYRLPEYFFRPSGSAGRSNLFIFIRQIRTDYILYRGFTYLCIVPFSFRKKVAVPTMAGTGSAYPARFFYLYDLFHGP